jgi:hypothetical protein
MKDFTAETIGTFSIISGKFSESRRLPAVHEARQYKMLCDKNESRVVGSTGTNG